METLFAVHSESQELCSRMSFKGVKESFREGSVFVIHLAYVLIIKGWLPEMMIE